MYTPILATKLYVPVPRANAVLRTRLIERMNDGLHGKLTLVSAPAGFGKTTLVSEWIEETDRPTAWLSLDEGDNDSTRFLTYFVAALQTIDPTIGEGMVDILHPSQPVPPESALTVLLNEITNYPDKFLFVMDDYHVIDSEFVDRAVTFLLENLPSQMHLVITSRDDPRLPLARLRARAQLTELRANDLRFTPSEAAEFLNEGMELSLSAQHITALEERTEGWIAGLQLAALSLQDNKDISGFIQAFAGDHRYIMDYLAEEVLDRQPEAVRNFLVQSSILDRMNGSLCEAVTDQQKGSEKLKGLEESNLFIMPLDDRRYWYRFHHLFGDVLRMHLMAEQPDMVPVLHQRASKWYEQNGSVADAIRHAFAAKDFERAADLIELAVPDMLKNRQESTLLGWLQALPDELFQYRPLLSVYYAGALLQNGKLEGVEVRLRDAERWLDVTEAMSAEMIVVDKEEFRHLPGWVANYRAANALILGRIHETAVYARRALTVFPEASYLGHGAAAALLGLADWASGDLEAAHRSYIDSMTTLQSIGHIADAIGCSLAIADIEMAQGRLRKAMSTYERGLKFATQQGAPLLRGAADMYVGMSDFHCECGDVDVAMQYLLKSEELGEFSGLPQNPYRWCVAMARVWETQGDLESALDMLDEAERLYMGDFSPNVRPVAALKIRIWIAQGKLDEALHWMRERELSIHDDISYVREFEYITLARILLASDSFHKAIMLLERIIKVAEEGKHIRSMMECLVLQALAYQMQSDIPSALVSLERAFLLAAPEGYVRIFLDEGSSMEQLLRKAATRKIMPTYTGKLLKAFDEHASETDEMHLSPIPVSQSLIEPLSQRELEILRLLKTELSGPEIAYELVIALSTLRTHTKRMYNKLNVNSRQQAVKRADELHLL